MRSYAQCKNTTNGATAQTVHGLWFKSLIIFSVTVIVAVIFYFPCSYSLTDTGQRPK